MDSLHLATRRINCPHLRLQDESNCEVGQVQKVYLSPDKNAAFVRFEFKTAIDFVLDQEWRLGGETLKVRSVVSTPRDFSPTIVPLNKPDTRECLIGTGPKTYGYEDYILTRNKYWIDGLHGGFGSTGPCKKPKRKKKHRDDFLHTCTSQAGKRSRKPKKKAKQKKKCAYLESSASLPFGVTASVSEGSRQVFVRGSTTVPLSVPLAVVTAQDLLALVTEATKVPTQLLHVTFEGRVLCDEMVPDIQHGSTLHYTVKGLGGSDSGEADTERKQKAEDLKNDANKMYKEKKYTDAVALYTASIIMFPLVPAFNNRAQCYLYLSEWQKAIEDCNQVLQLEPTNMKGTALLRRGHAEKLQENFDEAKRDLRIVCEKGPQIMSQQAGDLLQEIEKAQLAIEDQAKDKGGGEALSESARKRLKRKVRKEIQERAEGVEQETTPDNSGPEATTNVAPNQQKQAGDLLQETEKAQLAIEEQAKDTGGGEALSKSAKKRLKRKTFEAGDHESAASQAANGSSTASRKLTDGGDTSLNSQLPSPPAG
ncbi:hypothetical protein ACOMHN_016208 [Nucella lapillus]